MSREVMTGSGSASNPAVAVVLAWHAALNTGDVDGLLALSTDDVEVGGPRGTGRGADLLREWFGRANVVLDAGRVFASGHAEEVVVVEQTGRWRLDNGALGEPQGVASVFRVRAGRVASVLRYPELAEALAAAGLSLSDQTRLAP